MYSVFLKSGGSFTYVIHDDGDALYFLPNSSARLVLSELTKSHLFFFSIYLLQRYILSDLSQLSYNYKTTRPRNPLLGDRSNITRTFDSMKKFYLRAFRYEMSSYRHEFLPMNYNVFHLTFFQWYTYRYGFGKSLSTRLIKFLGLDSAAPLRLRDYFVTDFPHKKVQSLFAGSVSRLDDKLALILHKHQRANIKINCRKGLRLLVGLPCNGQRTRSNAKTSKKGIYMFDCKVQTPVRRIVHKNPWIT